MEEKQDTVNIIPLDYCVCFVSGDMKFYFSPVTSTRANILVRSPGALKPRLRAMQRYMNEQHPGGVFSFDYVEQDPYEMLREAVKKKEGYYKLVDLTHDEAVFDVECRGDVLQGVVASKQRRSEDKPTFYTPHIKGAHLDSRSRIALHDINCQCHHHGFGTEKGAEFNTRILCIHADALLQHHVEEQQARKPQSRQERFLQEHLFHPFRFCENWSVEHAGYFRPSNRSLASLEYEIPWEYYVANKSCYEIDTKIMHRPELLFDMLSDAVRTAVYERTAFFEVLRQRTEEAPASRKSQQQRQLYSAVRRTLTDAGYSFNGYCFEFGMSSRRFESARYIVDLVVDDSLLYYVARKKVSSIPNLALNNNDNLVPLVGIRRELLDDRTRTVTPAYVGIPTKLLLAEQERFVPVAVPDDMQRRYIKALDEQHDAPSAAKRKFGLMKK